MNDEIESESEEDRRLSGLLRATHAPANPAVWRRVRAELAPATRGIRLGTGALGFDRVLAWFTRPAALAAASAALVVAVGAGWGLLGTIAPAGDGGDLVAGDTATFIESLLDDTAAGATEAGDEGGTLEAPSDSGGRS